jgi:ATP-dependent helicase/nuclease subunit B
MGAIIITSSASHSRIHRARAWLETKPPAAEILILAATVDAASELARHVARRTGAAFGWHRLSFAQFAAVLAAPLLATRGLVTLGDLGVRAICARVVHRLTANGALGRYVGIANAPGFSPALGQVVTELRLARLGPEAIRGVAPDLVPLFEAYESELKEGSFTDWAGLLTVATDALTSDSFTHRLIGLPTIFLDATATSEAELSFVRALSLRNPKLLFIAPAADERTLTRVQSALQTQVENIDQTATPAAVVAEGASLARLQRHLFDESSPPAEPADPDEVLIFSAPGEGRECVEIARRVLALAQDGIAFDRIAVLLRSPEQYRAPLEEAFGRAGIPTHFARGARNPDPAGRAFYVLLKCAAEGLSARRFAEYLSLGQVPDSTVEGAPPEAAPRSERWVTPDQELSASLMAEEVTEEPQQAQQDKHQPVDAPVTAGQLRAPRRWERLLVEAAVIGGRERWRRRIEGLANELRLQIVELSDENEARAASAKRALQDLEALAGYALPLIEALAQLPLAATWGEWLDQLGALATRALRNPDRVLSVLSELAPMASVGPVKLDEVLLVLSDFLLEVAVPPSAQRYGKVFVGPIESARGLSFDAVFVPGLAERLFPRKIVEEPILLDALRVQVGSGLDTNEDRLAEERLSLAIAVGAAERRLYLSYPRLDLNLARPRVPSVYALEVVRAAEGQLPDFSTLARRAEAISSTRVGWPAPSDPTMAIDDAEYDLAILDRVFALPDNKGGSARYLLSANPHLARALRARYQRWSRKWTPADGLVLPSSSASAIMAKNAFAERSYSPTALQHYARCPYQFFLQAIHGLAPRETAESIDELDPLQRGALIHEIQFDFFRRLSASNLLPVRPTSLMEAREILDEVIKKAATRYYDDLKPAIDRVWEDGIAAIRADLREWLRRASEDESGYVPLYFEMSFGLFGRRDRSQADPHSVPDAVDLDCGIQLRGSIDLVEHHPSGFVRITDHKTGKAGGKAGQLVDGGKSLQPLLYALAAEKLLPEKGKVECARLYFCTSLGFFAEHIVPLEGRTRRAADEVVSVIGEAIGRPFLPAAPDKRQCDWCDYQVVCGPYEQQRTARKPQESLDALRMLRELP